MKRLLVIFLLMSSLASASDFNVSWTPIKEDIVNKEYIITIQNLDIDMRTVDVESFFEDTNFDTSKIRDVEFYEQTIKPVTKEIKHYKTIQVPKTVTQIDNKTKMPVNVTKMVNKRVLDYVEKKTVSKKILNKRGTKVLKNGKKIKEISHGKITLPSIKTKGKINNVGTKIFILKFKTPPDGSYGKVGLKINGKEYHPYWNSTWSNRKKIILTGNTSEPLLDRQLLLNITYEPEMNPDFSDIRFCNNTDQLSAWLESKVNESYALIWIKFPHIPTIGETEDYRMYYGNSEASAYWDGDATFEFFDDFDDGDISDWSIITGDSNTYNADNQYLYDTGATARAVISHEINNISNFSFAFHFYPDTPTASDTRPGISADANPHPDYGYHVWIADNGILRLYSPSQTIITDGSWSRLAQWYNIQFTKYSTSFELFIDGISQGTGSNSEEDIMHYIRLEGSSVTGRPARYDDIRISKYTFPEPAYAFGDAEYCVNSIYFNSSNPYYNLIDYKGDIAVNRTYSSSDDLEWTAQAVNGDTGLIITSMGSSEIDFTTYEGILDWLQLVNLDNSKIYILQNSSGDLEEHQASGNTVNFTTDLSPDDYEIEITAVPTPSPTITPTSVQPANYSDTKLSDSTIKSFYYPFMYILFIVIIIGGFMHVFGN